MTFTKEQKEEIANKIKNISFDQVEREMTILIEWSHSQDTFSPRSRIGNNIVDYFTFVQRLETKGKYNAHFFDFLENIEEFKQKKFIQTMLQYYKEVKNKNNTKNEYIVYKEVYNICISAINIMRPLNCIEIYKKYHAKRVLNFCAGWGGSCVASAALNIESFYGIEINTDLQQPYNHLITYLKTKSATKMDVSFCNAVDFDYTTIEYDTVFTSPPYYFLEKYPHSVTYTSKKEMDETFYKPVFYKTYQSLQWGGWYIINVCREIYENVLKDLLGEAHEQFPLKKSKRQNNYTEMVYVWCKKK
jgi:predicted RNA methylase